MSPFAPRAAQAGRKPSKYRNIKTEIDGIVFDSKREARRWGELKLMQRAGYITDLERQVPYWPHVNGTPIGKYIPDFVYKRNGELVLEDVKSTATETSLFNWKAKHVAAEYGLKVEIVR